MKFKFIKVIIWFCLKDRLQSLLRMCGHCLHILFWFTVMMLHEVSVAHIVTRSIVVLKWRWNHQWNRYLYRYIIVGFWRLMTLQVLLIRERFFYVVSLLKHLAHESHYSCCSRRSWSWQNEWKGASRLTNSKAMRWKMLVHYQTLIISQRVRVGATV